METIWRPVGGVRGLQTTEARINDGLAGRQPNANVHSSLGATIRPIGSLELNVSSRAPAYPSDYLSTSQS